MVKERSPGTKPAKTGRKTTKTTIATNKTTAADTGPLLFFSPNEPHGEFCQWYPCSFTVAKSAMSALVGRAIDPDDPDGWQPLYFGCAEQFMMYCKAGRFGDAATQRAVLATADPKEQKRLARLTAGFDAAGWDAIKSDVVVMGNMAKFGQNAALRERLLATGNRLLAEAASQDRVWGIGFDAKSAAVMPREKWGENRLGIALMEVRRRLRIGKDEVWE